MKKGKKICFKIVLASIYLLKKIDHTCINQPYDCRPRGITFQYSQNLICSFSFCLFFLRKFLVSLRAEASGSAKEKKRFEFNLNPGRLILISILNLKLNFVSWILGNFLYFHSFSVAFHTFNLKSGCKLSLAANLFVKNEKTARFGDCDKQFVRNLWWWHVWLCVCFCTK